MNRRSLKKERRARQVRCHWQMAVISCPRHPARQASSSVTPRHQRGYRRRYRHAVRPWRQRSLSKARAPPGHRPKRRYPLARASRMTSLTGGQMKMRSPDMTGRSSGSIRQRPSGSLGVILMRPPNVTSTTMPPAPIAAIVVTTTNRHDRRRRRVETNMPAVISDKAPLLVSDARFLPASAPPLHPWQAARRRASGRLRRRSRELRMRPRPIDQSPCS